MLDLPPLRRTALGAFLILATGSALAAAEPRWEDLTGVYTGTLTCRMDRFDTTLTLRAEMGGGLDAEVVQAYHGREVRRVALPGRFEPSAGRVAFTRIAPGEITSFFVEPRPAADRVGLSLLHCRDGDLTLDPKRSKKLRKEVARLLEEYGRSPRRVDDARNDLQACGAFVRWARTGGDDVSRPGGRLRRFASDSTPRALVDRLFSDERFVPAFGQPYDRLAPGERGKRGQQLARCFESGALRQTYAWMQRDLAPYFRSTPSPEGDRLVRRLPEIRRQQEGLRAAVEELDRLPAGLEGVSAALRLAAENRRTLPLASEEETNAFAAACESVLTRNGPQALRELLDRTARQEPSLAGVEALRRLEAGEAPWGGKPGERPARAGFGRRGARRGPVRRRSSPQDPCRTGRAVDLFDRVPAEGADEVRRRAGELARQGVAPLVEAELRRLRHRALAGMAGLEAIAEWDADFELRFRRLAEAEDLARAEALVRDRRRVVRPTALREIEEGMSRATERTQIDQAAARYAQLDPELPDEAAAVLRRWTRYFKARRLLDPCVTLTAPGPTTPGGEPTEREMCETVWRKYYRGSRSLLGDARACRELSRESALFAARCLHQNILSMAGDTSPELVAFSKRSCRRGEDAYRCTFDFRVTSENAFLKVTNLLLGALSGPTTGDFLRAEGGWRYRRLE